MIKNLSSCRLNTNGCVAGPDCGNGIVDSGESCDGDCLISTENCVVGVDCGNGVLDVGELCDGGLFVGGVSLCSDYSVDFTDGSRFGSIDECSDFEDFVGGVLSCSSCRLDTNGCVAGPDCGNGLVDVGESCDGVCLLVV